MDNKKLNRFWQGMSSVEERKELLQNIKEKKFQWQKELHDEFAQTLEEDNISMQDNTWFQEQLLLLHKKIAARHQFRHGSKTIFSLRIKIFYKAAAAVLLIGVVTSIVFYMKQSENKNKATFGIGLTTRTNKDNGAFFIIRNKTNSAEKILLPDSSLVTLFSNSILKYTKKYGLREREVELVEGKAVFHVKEDKSHPFIVLSKGLQTTDLGTVFTVDAKTKDKVVVSLQEGIISIKNRRQNIKDTNSIILKPGQEYVLNIQTNQVQVSQITSALSSIKNKISEKIITDEKGTKTSIAFKQSAVEDVFKKLMSFYNIRIKYDEDDIKDIWFTGEFRITDDIQMVMLSVCNINGLNFNIDGNQITIFKK